MSDRAADICSLIGEIEAEHGFRVPYACESGSRAWGFASPDSDYDIRFIFVRPPGSYLSTVAEPDALDLPIADDLDPGGWDARKAALLLGRSNGALLEWLHSPIVYRAEPGFLVRWRAVAREVFSPRDSADHYRGLARRMLAGKLTGAEVRAKDYLYALRAVLAGRWVLDGRGIAPVPFVELLPVATDGVRALVPGLLDHKARTGESERMGRIPELDAFLTASVAEIESALDGQERGVSDPRPALDRLVRTEILGGPSGVPTRDAFTLERVREPDVLLFDSVAGSHAYGTAVDSSDEDRRGVFVAPRRFLLGLDQIDQVSDARSDQTYYELGRFVDLLLKNNPNALELLGMPDGCVRFRHPLFGLLEPELFLSKLCARTFGEYAMGQVRKARGLNKKIVNPQPEKRKAVLDFCRVPVGQGSVPVQDWLRGQGLRTEDCGLSSVDGAPGLMALYHRPGANYRGLVSQKDPDALVLSRVEKNDEPVVWVCFNQDAFRAHCKAHREYWEWARNRNEARYETNAAHGRGYDSKNLLHTLRLLDMAGEIAREGVIRVRRPNRGFLLRVRAGEFSYEELVERAEAMNDEVRAAFAASDLPDSPDAARANELLVHVREEFSAAGGAVP